MSAEGLFSEYRSVALLAAVRTPWVDLSGALSQVSPTDLGIAVARAVLAQASVVPEAVEAVIAGSVAQASFDAYFLPRHIGLYAGIPQAVPALGVQRICGTGFEVLAQAGSLIEHQGLGAVLSVATESMSRNPIAAYTHRNGFRVGAPVEFKDVLWEALFDPAAGIDMIQTAERIAQEFALSRTEVDSFAARSFARAQAAQIVGWLHKEILPLTSQAFTVEGYQPRHLQLPRGVEQLSTDTHIRDSSLAALQRLNPVHAGGVQTAGNSCALVDGAAAVLLGSTAIGGTPPLAWLRASAVCGVAPQTMGLGPVAAIRLLLQRTGLHLSDIGRFEINEAQGAQVLAVQRQLEIDDQCLNVHGGAIALGHPLAATGLRLTLTLARQLRAAHLRYGIASACIGGGQGMAVLIENPDYSG